MEQVKQKARDLLESGVVQVVIGYTEGSNGRIRPFFAQHAEEISKLVSGEQSHINLAVYLTKPEVRSLGKVAVVANLAVAQGVVQLAAENQIKEGDVVLLLRSETGAPIELATFVQIVDHARQERAAGAGFDHGVDIESLEPAERWNFWRQEFDRCIRCYACRAACPLCYCEQCVVECNQPQWIPVAAHALGNLEWHINRAMHLAGRCVDCGACTEACPVDIPLFLINRFLSTFVVEQFQQKSGVSVTLDYPFSAFKNTDREEFIK